MNNYLTLVTKLKEGIIIINEQKEILFTNDSFNKLLGYESNEIVGLKFYDIILTTSEPNKLFRENIGDDDSNENNYDTIYLKAKNGKVLKKLMSLSNFEEGEDTFCAMLFLDTHNIDLALTEKIDQLQTLVEHNTDHIFQVDEKYHITYINHVAPGLVKKDVLGTSFLNYLPSEASELHVKTIVDKVFESGIASTYDVDFNAPTGTMYYQTNVTPVFDEGKVVRLNFVTRDITDEYNNKRALDNKELFLEKMTSNSQNGIYIFDLKQRKTIYANKNCKEILGYSEDDYNNLSGDGLIGLIHKDDHQNINNHWSEILASKIDDKPIQIVYRIKTKQGKYKWLRSKDSAYEFDSDGNVISLLGSFIDITDIINLRDSKNELLKKNSEIEQILYQASHDIKSPINNVAQLIELSIENGEMHEAYLDIINKSVNRLNSLVISLLDYGETDKHFELSNVDLNNVLEDVLIDLNDKIIVSEAEISIPHLPVIKADRIGLYRIFQNLLSNAIKFKIYKSNPFISIEFSENESEWCFSIVDNGIGIADQKKEEIFEAFIKLHSSTEYDGSGLGLANCKKIIEMHQGEIWVEDNKNGGSKFLFTIKKELETIKKETLIKASPFNLN